MAERQDAFIKKTSDDGNGQVGDKNGAWNIAGNAYIASLKITIEQKKISSLYHSSPNRQRIPALNL